MRRVLRHLFTLCSAASLVLCVAVGVLWVRSYFVSDQFRRVDVRPGNPSTAYDRSILFGCGAVIYCEFNLQGDPLYADRLKKQMAAHGQIPYLRTGVYNPNRNYGRLGFSSIPMYRDGVRVGVPLWFVALCFALPALPAVLSIARKLRQRHRNRHGTCPACGYDLRAHKGGDRCPECGTELPHQSPTLPSL